MSDVLRQSASAKRICEFMHLAGQSVPDRPTRSEDEGPYRRSDGKWIKPPYWQKPDITGLLAEQTKQAELDESENVAMSGGTGISAIQSVARQKGECADWNPVNRLFCVRPEGHPGNHKSQGLEWSD